MWKHEGSVTEAWLVEGTSRAHRATRHINGIRWSSFGPGKASTSKQAGIVDRVLAITGIAGKAEGGKAQHKLVG